MLLDLSPFKNIEFRRLFLSQAISMLGMQMTMVTIPYQVYHLTNSTAQTGFVSLVELVCLIFTALFGGALADSLDRRRMLVVCECLMAGLVGLLVMNSTLRDPSLWLIYVLAGLIAGVGGFHRPAFEALTPVLVAKKDMSKVSALMAMKMFLAGLIGPSVAGILVAHTGAASTYSLNVLSFIVSLFFLLRIKTPLGTEKAVAPSAREMVAEVLGGFNYLKERKDLLGSYLVDFCAMVFCMPQVLFPAFADYYQEISSLGILYTSVALGSFTVTLFSGWTIRVKRLGLAIAVVASGWAASMASVGLVWMFWLIPPCLFLAGAFDGLSGIFRLTMWNESIPTQYRGRLSSFSMLSYTSGPLLGNAFMGFLASKIGLHPAMLVGGSLGLLAVLLARQLLPEFNAYRSPESSSVAAL